uniref:non-specific serine/threonine protein kinase n=1 Tax=Leersia perrieri TaxID=77586 RepID=A0A0D9WMC0_9ORYZ
MASPSPTAAPSSTLLLLLVSLALAAAQLPLRPPAQGDTTNSSDAAALHAVFKRWGMQEDPAPPAYDPCTKRVWHNSSEMEASIDCSCSDPAPCDCCRITHLKVTGYRNITSMPEELFNLTDLVSLDLSNNNLSGRINPNIANLTKLEIWWMFDNNIDGPVPEFIANFSNLKDLRIYGMKLEGPIPSKFTNLTNLTHLMIGDLGGGGNYSVNFTGVWSNLSVLDLRSNNLSGPIEQVFQSKKNLRYLGFTHSFVHSSSMHRNYIGTSIAASGSNLSEDVSLLNCLDMKECNPRDLNNLVPFAVNCGGKEHTSNRLQTVFHDDSTDLRSAGFHVDTSNKWVVSHVGADPFSNSTGIVNTSKIISGTDMPDLYRTARTSTGALWYYVVGLTSGTYTVQLFFAEIVIESDSGRRLFNIEIQGRRIKTDFNIFEEAGGFNKAINITLNEIVTTPVLKIYLYWSGRGTCCIPYNGTYGPLVSAIRVFPSPVQASPAPTPHTSRRNEKRRGVIAGIAALSIAAALISSSVVYLWWKWVSLVKHPKA